MIWQTSVKNQLKTAETVKLIAFLLKLKIIVNTSDPGNPRHRLILGNNAKQIENLASLILPPNIKDHR